MAKPTWLHKAVRSRPWAEFKTVRVGERYLTIWAYNFGIELLGDTTAEDYKEAVEWIDAVCPRPEAEHPGQIEGDDGPFCAKHPMGCREAEKP